MNDQEKGVDLHVHTKLSDGKLSLLELIDYAVSCNLQAIAITDHNTYDPSIEELKSSAPLTIITGSEFSTQFRFRSGRTKSIHIKGLFFDYRHPQIQAIFHHEKEDKINFVKAILSKLRQAGIQITYEELIQTFPQTQSPGRVHICELLRRKGYVSDVSEGLDLYIGESGEKRCYVNPLDYCSSIPMEDCIHAILNAKGMPDLAHPYYYGLDESELHELISSFKQHAQDAGCMEVYYRDYSALEQQHLFHLAMYYQLLPSCGSDYHGFYSQETLISYPYSIYEAILNRYQKLYGVSPL